MNDRFTKEIADAINANLAPCPQCGNLSDSFTEGICTECHVLNQGALDLHNAEYAAWKLLGEAEREARIRFELR